MEGVTVDNLGAFLAHLDRYKRELKPVINDSAYKATREVESDSKGRAAAVGRQALRAAATIHTIRNASSVLLRAGDGLPFFFGAEFGSKRYGQFKPWRGNQSANPFEGGAGYFLFPSFRADEEDYLTSFRKGVLDMVSDTFK